MLKNKNPEKYPDERVDEAVHTVGTTFGQLVVFGHDAAAPDGLYAHRHLAVPILTKNTTMQSLNDY